MTFREHFRDRFGDDLQWISCQVSSNKAVLPSKAKYRRNGVVKENEGIELGDLRRTFRDRTVIIEYESDAISVHNLVKYWAYPRGELSARPKSSVVICHFSNWSSYGSLRDLWAWLRDQMIGDPRRVVDVAAEQFDHGGNDSSRTMSSIAACLEYLSNSLPPQFRSGIGFNIRGRR